MVDYMRKGSDLEKGLRTRLNAGNIDLRRVRSIYARNVKFARLDSLNKTAANRALKVQRHLIITRRATVQGHTLLTNSNNLSKLSVERARSGLSRCGECNLPQQRSSNFSHRDSVPVIADRLVSKTFLETGLAHFVRNVQLQARINYLHKVNANIDLYQAKVIERLVTGMRRHVRSVYSEWLVYDNRSEFLRRYYEKNEVAARFVPLCELYKKYCNMKPSCCILEQRSILLYNIYLKRELIRERRSLIQRAGRVKSSSDILTPEFLSELARDDRLNNPSSKKLRNSPTSNAVYYFDNHESCTAANNSLRTRLICHNCPDVHLLPTLHKNSLHSPSRTEISHIKPLISPNNSPSLFFDSNDNSIPSKIVLAEQPKPKIKSRLVSICSPKCLVNYKSAKPNPHFHGRNSWETKGVREQSSSNSSCTPLAVPAIKVEGCSPAGESSDCDDIEMLCTKYADVSKSTQSCHKEPEARASAHSSRLEMSAKRMAKEVEEGSKTPQVSVRAVRRMSLKVRKLDRTMMCCDNGKRVSFQ